MTHSQNVAAHFGERGNRLGALAVPSEQSARASQYALDFRLCAQIEGDDRGLIVGGGPRRLVDHDPKSPALLVGKRGVACDLRAIRREISESIIRLLFLTAANRTHP